MTQKQFYKTQAWKNIRAQYILQRELIDGGLCEVCKMDHGKVVHHKVWLNDDNCNDPSVALNMDNFRYECQICHNREENNGCRKRYTVTAGGEVIPH